MSDDPELPSIADTMAAIAAGQLVLAKHRSAPFDALVERLEAADLPGIAADLRAIGDVMTQPVDKALMEQRAVVLADTPTFVASLAKANADLLAPPKPKA